MVDNTGSFLPQVAAVEQAELEENQRVQDECDALITEAKREVSEELASLPEQLQERKRKRLADVRSKAETEAADLLADASAAATRVIGVSSKSESGILNEILEQVIPVR